MSPSTSPNPSAPRRPGSSRTRITGLATAGDVRLLGAIIAAERDRLAASAAEEALLDEPDYSSPFLAMPF